VNYNAQKGVKDLSRGSMKKLLMVSAGSVFMALGAVAKGQAIQMVYEVQ
jgi:hypothetical protein